MSVTALDFYTFAKRIADSAAGEIDHRNAISRVYYAAYHECPSRLSKLDASFRAEQGHSEFCGQLMRSPARDPKRALGVALNFLRQHRNVADYALQGRSFNATDTKTAFGAYDNVIKLLASVAPEKGK